MEVGWGLRCLLGINYCERKCEGRIGQRENSNPDAGAAKVLANPVELALPVQVSCLGLKWTGLCVPPTPQPLLQAAAWTSQLFAAEADPTAQVNSQGWCRRHPIFGSKSLFEGGSEQHISWLTHCLVIFHVIELNTLDTFILVWILCVTSKNNHSFKHSGTSLAHVNRGPEGRWASECSSSSSFSSILWDSLDFVVVRV